MVPLLLFAILVTLLGLWPLVLSVGAGGLLAVGATALVLLPIALVGELTPSARRRRDYERRLAAYCAGTGPMPPEGLP